MYSVANYSFAVWISARIEFKIFIVNISVTADGSLLSPTGGVNTIPPDTECSEGMSKRTQKDSGEERVTAKPKPMMNLVSRCSERTPVVLPSTASESPRKTRHESQSPLSLQIEKYYRTVRPVVYARSSSYSE